MAPHTDRRQFGKLLFKAVVAGSLLTLSVAGCDVAPPTGPVDFQPLTLDLEDPRYGALKQVGGAVKIPLRGQKPLIVTRVDDTSYAAFTSQCTHQGCEVLLPNARGILTCPCHGARFDLRGRVQHGPARVNLPATEVVKGEGTLTLQPLTS